MVAETQFARERGEEPTYIKGHFDEIAKKLRDLKTVGQNARRSVRGIIIGRKSGESQ